jgi:hypothetical protein
LNLATKKSASGRGKVKNVMHEYKTGQLKSGSGRKVANRKQAVAIALNEARESGAKIPRKGAGKKAAKKTAAKKSTAKKSTAKKSTTKKSSAKKSTAKRTSAKRTAKKSR